MTLRAPLDRQRAWVIAAGAIAPLLGCAAIATFRDAVSNANAVLCLVIIVVAASSTGIRTAGIVAALSSAAWFDFFLTEPYNTFTITDRADIETTVLLVIIGIAVTEVALWGRRQARADVIASRARVVAATDQTRRRLERDLHDGTQQRLVSLALDLRSVEARLPEQMAELRSELAAAANGLNAALNDLREVCRGIHPAILSEGGLDPAIKSLARRSAVPVELDLAVKPRLPQAVEEAAYYVVSEALANAAKHAHASVVRVAAAIRGDHLEVSVRDDGVGGADPGKGSGLVGLSDRVSVLGGTLKVTSPRGKGTTLNADLPLASPRYAVKPG